MKRTLWLLIAAVICIALIQSAFATGSGDVEIRLNGCANMAFIGQPNTVEFWIRNDAILDSMRLGFQFDIGRNYQFNSTYGNFGYVNEEGDAVGAWNLYGLGVLPSIDNLSPDQILLYGGASGGGLPIHTTHSLCYTMEVNILSGQLPLAGGFCVDNVFIPPMGSWFFVDPGGEYAPDFQGNPNSGTSNPDAPQVCFDIVNPCWADGDIDNNGIALTTTDYIALRKYLLYCSYTPPLLYKCDLSGDGVIDQQDIVVFDNYNSIGMGAFVCGYPVPTRCDPCAYPSVMSTNPPHMALGVAKTANVEVTYNFDLVPSSIENINVFHVVGTQSGWHTSGTFSYNSPMYTETFDPTNDFFGGETVIGYISPGVESTCGAISPCSYQWHFTVHNKKGNGAFAPGVWNYAGGNVSSAVAADFNGDGYLDLATVFDDTDSMSCMLNNGSGQLSLSRGVYPVGFKGGASSKPKGLVAADYDLDNDIDVVAVAGGDDIDSSSFVFMENDGNGTFTSTGLQSLVTDGISHTTPSMITGDYNGDGYNDLIMAIGDYAPDSAAVMYFENDGSGVFSSPTRGVYPVGFKGGASSKPPGLIGGPFSDGPVASDDDEEFALFMDNYSLDSAALVFLCCLIDDSIYVDDLTAYPVPFEGPSNGVPACMSTDLDGDSDMDVMIVMASPFADTVYTLGYFNEGGTFYATGVYPVGFQGGSSGKPAGIIADVDADDDMDLIGHFGTDSIWVFANNGDGQFEVKRGVYPVGYKGSSTNKPASLVAGDFDHNGSTDIMVGFADTVCTAVMFGERECTCATPPDSMVAWFPFDETAGPDAENACEGNDGVHMNDPVIESGMVRNCLCFDGLDAYVDVTSYAEIEIGTGDLSIDAWIKRSVDDNDETRIIVDKRTDAAGGYVGYSFYLYQGKLGIQLSTPTQSFYNWVSDAYITKDIWHHVAVTVDRDETEGLKFYLDGAQVLPSYNPTGRDGSLANDFPMRVASRSYEESGIFYGCIDEVEVFDRVLEPQEVFNIFWAADCGKCRYVTGDADGSGAVDIDDVVYLIQYIFAGGPEPQPYESGDVDCSGGVDIDDVVYVITYIFGGGPPPGDPNDDGVPDC
jgi:hypothetical protein